MSQGLITDYMVAALFPGNEPTIKLILSLSQQKIAQAGFQYVSMYLIYE